jgi:hypothetical protein
VNPHKHWLRGLLTQKDERASFTKFKQLFVAKLVCLMPEQSQRKTILLTDTELAAHAAGVGFARNTGQQRRQRGPLGSSGNFYDSRREVKGQQPSAAYSSCSLKISAAAPAAWEGSLFKLVSAAGRGLAPKEVY